MTKKKMTNSARVEFTLSKKDRSQYDNVSFVVAYKNIFLKDKEYYPLSFGEYDIHHKDRDKDNKEISNLDIITRDEHEQIYNLGLRGKKELWVHNYEQKQIRLNAKKKENEGDGNFIEGYFPEIEIWQNNWFIR
jgi:hypothetical protein